MQQEQGRLFDLATPRYRLTTQGVNVRVQPSRWAGLEVAECIKKIMNSTAAKNQQGRQGRAPVIVGAIPFDPEKPAQLFLPKTVHWQPGNNVVPTNVTNKQARAVPYVSDAPAYQDAVRNVVRRIRAGQVEKVVLARSLEICGEMDFDPEEVQARLKLQNPSAYTFRMDLVDETDGLRRSLVGASPELVLASEKGVVVSHPLAGSAPRHADQHKDIAAGQKLLGSAKNLHEHSHVVQAVARSFRIFAKDVSVPENPSLISTPVIWHLGTRIVGNLRNGISPIELAYAMHPTPAVCGWPSKAARGVIEELENFSRGFYAGLIGWIDADGRCEWALTLRCGVIEDNRATLYAGAGIMENSSPMAEHLETDVKFSTFAEALGSIGQLESSTGGITRINYV